MAASVVCPALAGTVVGALWATAKPNPTCVLSSWQVSVRAAIWACIVSRGGYVAGWLFLGVLWWLIGAYWWGALVSVCGLRIC